MHRLTYYEKISLKNKTPEEAEKITKLFNDNINIANKVASKYYKTHYWDFDEALQIARMGLWKACLIWDPSKFRISTLAYNVINRDFIDFDRQQKRQPSGMFSLEDNSVTDDLTLNDVLVDENTNIEEDYIQNEDLADLNQDIIYILEDIADENSIPTSIVKLVYIVYVESTQDNQLNTRMLNFIPKQTIKSIISQLQNKLLEIM